jgi:endonuclease YncB( thermonuclease family)
MSILKRILKWVLYGFAGFMVLFLGLVVVAIITAPSQEEATGGNTPDKPKQEQSKDTEREHHEKSRSPKSQEAAVEAVGPGSASKVNYPDPVSGLTLERAVDGDTIEVNKPVAGTTDVRLIGIDTPEKCQPLGPEATDWMSTFEGTAVRLEFDEEKKDQCGRLLAYVYDDITGEMLNQRMIAGGYAQVYTVPPNDRYEPKLRDAQEQAKDLSMGFGMDIWSLPKSEDKLLADHGNGIGQGDGSCVLQPQTSSPTATASPSPDGAGGGDGDRNRNYGDESYNTAPANTAAPVACESGVPAPYPNHPEDGDGDGCINE